MLAPMRSLRRLMAASNHSMQFEGHGHTAGAGTGISSDDGAQRSGGAGAPAASLAPGSSETLADRPLARPSSLARMAASSFRAAVSPLVAASSFMTRSSGLKVQAAGRYVTYNPWDDRGVNLKLLSARRVWADHAGREAVALHGQVTKLHDGLAALEDSLALRVGDDEPADVGEKERILVLTVRHLVYFRDHAAACIEGGYLCGAFSPPHRGAGVADGDGGGGGSGSAVASAGVGVPLDAVTSVTGAPPRGSGTGYLVVVQVR